MAKSYLTLNSILLGVWKQDDYPFLGRGPVPVGSGPGEHGGRSLHRRVSPGVVLQIRRGRRLGWGKVFDHLRAQLLLREGESQKRCFVSVF